MNTLDSIRILSKSEIAMILSEIRRKARSVNTRQNRIIFRLSVCCGLRVSEIVGLKLRDIRLSGSRPHIGVPSSIAKRHKARRVPLWWDEATLSEFELWKAERTAQGASAGDAFVCSQSKGTLGKALSVRNAQHRFKVACKCLGAERVRDVSIHSGRHSFCSHALAGGRSLAEVRDAAGHANISTTSLYLHAVRPDDDTVGSLFAF